MKALVFLRASDRGAITAEFAVVLPTIMLVAAILLSLGSAVMTRLSCQNAAGAAARVISSSLQADSDARARAVRAAKSAASSSATVTLKDQNQGVRGVAVSVSCPVFPGPLGIIPARVSGEAVGFPQDFVYDGGW